MPGIKNYSTEISVAKTTGEIIGHLSRRGVRAISTLYDEEGRPEGIGFEMQTEYGRRYFELPVRTEGVFQAMKTNTTVPAKYRTREQAERVAWRIAQDWLEAQSALIDAGLATLDEVMLPYLVTGDGGQTMYQVYRGRQLELVSGKDGQ